MSRLINLNPIYASRQKIVEVKSDISIASGNKETRATTTQSFINVVRMLFFFLVLHCLSAKQRRS